MTDNKNPGNDPSAEFERQRKRKVLLFAAILGCIFLVVLWLIFRPAPVKPQEGAAGINTTVPDGKAQATVGDKRKAAEQLRSEYSGSLRCAGGSWKRSCFCLGAEKRFQWNYIFRGMYICNQVL